MIKLEYFTKADYDQLLNWINDAELLLHWAGTQFKFPLTRKKLDWYIEDTNDFNKSGVFIYKAIDTETDTPVGHISLTSINRKNRSARITRVFVDPSQRGKGIAADMIQSLLEIGFKDLNLHRMSLGVYTDNKNAVGLYKKIGFHEDGILRDIQRHKDTYWSLMEMSVLEDEWRDLNLEKSKTAAYTSQMEK